MPRKWIFVLVCLAIVALVGSVYLLDRLLFLHHKGTLGAASVEELVERYKKAHRDKDLEALRAIHLQMRQGIPWWPSRSSRMVGIAENDFPTLFEIDLVDVEIIHVAPRDGMINFEYIRKRNPVQENGFSRVQRCTTAGGEPYKLLLICRRPGDPAGPLMELDPDFGMSAQADGRFYLYAGSELADVARWIETARLPPVYRAPDHQSLGRAFDKLKDVPADWVRIVRPRK